MNASHELDVEQQHQMLTTLMYELTCAGTPGSVEHIETHISHVILAGEFAYKIKKPVNLGFLDFSTLERRCFCCEEEIRLNSRLAQELYLDVVPITGSVEQPELDGEGDTIEYTVRMRRFSQSDLLNENLPDVEMIAQIASRVARFHQQIPVADESMPFGTPERVVQPMLQNFRKIRETGGGDREPQLLESLEAWTRSQADHLTALLQQRRQGGHIRECHGDMHLGNITTYAGRLQIFDGIEFNPDLRWIDTLSEVAFLIMDLQHRGLNEESSRFLNDYLEQTGDYQALPLLSFYQLYRAMVRAKVAAIRLSQPGLIDSEKEAAQHEFDLYLRLAKRYTEYRSPSLLITHGLSGSGKSLFSGWLAERLPAIRLRSDVERQRLFAKGNKGEPYGELAEGIYNPEATRATYAQLRKLAATLLNAGYSVIVDATFLKMQQRRLFQDLAAELDLAYLILDCNAPDAILRERLLAREQRGGDPSEANRLVLEMQIEQRQPLTEQERDCVLSLDTQVFPPLGLFEQVMQRLLKWRTRRAGEKVPDYT